MCKELSVSGNILVNKGNQNEQTVLNSMLDVLVAFLSIVGQRLVCSYSFRQNHGDDEKAVSSHHYQRALYIRKET